MRTRRKRASRARANLRAVLAPAAAGAGVMAATAAVLVPVLAGGARGGPSSQAAYPPRATHAGPAAQACTPENAVQSLRPSTDGGAAVDRIKKRGRLVVGVDQNTYRWGYLNPATSKLEGFDITLARAITKSLLGDEDKVAFLAIPTNQRVPALQGGRVDMVVRTMTINCARKKQVAFSTAYFQAGQQLLAPRTAELDFDDSLKGKRVCAARGSTAETELERRPHGATVVRVANQLDCLVKLQLGEADAVVTDNALGAAQAAQDPTVELKGKPFTQEAYGVAMNKSDTDLVRWVNKVLEDYRDDGSWKAAYDKWLKKDLPKISGAPDPEYAD